jgi:hypothetical protein
LNSVISPLVIEGGRRAYADDCPPRIAGLAFRWLSRNSGKPKKILKTAICKHLFRTRWSKTALDAPRLSFCFSLLSARKPDNRTDPGTLFGKVAVGCSSRSTAALRL